MCALHLNCSCTRLNPKLNQFSRLNGFLDSSFDIKRSAKVSLTSNLSNGHNVSHSSCSAHALLEAVFHSSAFLWACIVSLLFYITLNVFPSLSLPSYFSVVDICKVNNKLCSGSFVSVSAQEILSVRKNYFASRADAKFVEKPSLSNFGLVLSFDSLVYYS